MLLADAPLWLTDNAVPIGGIFVVLVGLLVLGRADLMRFSWTRVWAISGVCFAESIRRKVLWILPLAIVGLVAVVQFQQPTDEQDAIRQTTKFCLFAAGLVVVLATLILACTNLPREIENRVIFTVVTKPTTRLEIVLGKVVGFARVSFTILLVMGLFTYGYLRLRAGLLEADLRHRLAEPNEVEPISRPTSEHYVNAGLLNAKTLADPVSLDLFGRPPEALKPRRYITPEGYLLVPFSLPSDAKAADPDADPKAAGLLVNLRVGFDPPPATTPPAGTPPGRPVAPAGPPQLSVQVFDPNVNAFLTAQQFQGGTAVAASADGRQTAVLTVPDAVAGVLRKYPVVYLAVSVAAGQGSLWVDVDPADPPVTFDVPVTTAPGVMHLGPAVLPGNPLGLTFTGRQGTFGQQVKGAKTTAAAETAVFRFRGTHVTPGPDGRVPIEMRVGIEKSSDSATDDVLSDVRLTVTDPATGRSADLGSFHPENNRTLYASLPAGLVTSGDFDVAAQCLTPDQWVGLKPTSLSLVQSDSSFGLNLTKSLAVLWLLSILVTAISVFCSTFLSWPTAVVFTLVLLFGRWGLDELGDAASAGLGRSFTSDFGMTDPALVHTVSHSVELLNTTFKTVASVLPDLSSFGATDDIDRGVAIPARTLVVSTLTLLGFGLPLTVLAYLILKNKEVAP